MAEAKKATGARKKAASTTKAANAKRLTAERKIKMAVEAAEELEVSSAADFKKGKEGTKLLLPSGHVCLAVNKGLMPFVEAGKVPNTLMPMVQAALDSGEGKKPRAATTEELRAIAADKEALAETMSFVNVIVLDCVRQPHIVPLPARDEEGEFHLGPDGEKIRGRNAALLYVDELDVEDKMFVFQWVVGGTREVERFRSESASLMADIHDGDPASGETE